MSEPSVKANMTAPPQKSSSLALVLATLALVLILLVVGAGATYVWQQMEIRDQASGKQTSALANLAKENNVLKAQLNQLQQTVSASNDQMLSDIRQLREQSQFQSETLAQLKNGNRLDWLLAESEYLLRLANQRLVLEQDIPGAILILSSAEQVLLEISDPALQAVQTQVASELLALTSIPNADKQSHYARLQALISGIQRLTYNATEPVNQPDTESKASQQSAKDVPEPDHFSSALTAISDAFSDAIRIRKVTQDAPALLVPEQRYFAKQNLRLMYEQSALALLNGQDTAYQQSLNRAETWLKQYFPSNAATRAHVASIEALKAVELSPEIPDISGSLRLLKTQIEGLYRQQLLRRQLSAGDEIQLMELESLRSQMAITNQEPVSDTTSDENTTSGDSE